MAEGESQEAGQSEIDPSVRQVVCNGVTMKTDEVEAKLDQGNIQDAEAAFRDKLSLTSEEARALLGRLEYKRGNTDSALRIFNDIDLQAAIQRLQQSLGERQGGSKRGRSRSSESVSSGSPSQHSTNLVLDAVFLKAKCLQKRRKFSDAIEECKSMLDVVEKAMSDGAPPDTLVETKLQEPVSRTMALLPELLMQIGSFSDGIDAYRQALQTQWNLDDECFARIQKGFAVFLLYSGVEASPPSAPSQVNDPYIPKNNVEEAILLLMILMRKFYQGKIKWDPSVLEHLTFALSLCSQTLVLAKQLEEFLPGVIHRIERWKTMALAFTGAGQNKSALDLLRKTLHPYEQPNDIISSLMAAKICSEDASLAAEGVKHAQTVLSNVEAGNASAHFKSVGLHMLGICLGKQAKISSSDFERSQLQSGALKSLESALALDPQNLDLIFMLGIQYAEHRNLDAALRYAKLYLDATGGSMIKGWRLLALVLSGQRRFSEADVVIDAALDETSKWDQGPLLRTKAKLKIAQSLHKDAIETYRHLLALVQAQKKSSGPNGNEPQPDDESVNEFEVWLGLATLYSSLSHWKDAEVCLGKARALKEYSPETLHIEGVIQEKQGNINKALAAYINSLLIEPKYVPCKILISTALAKMGEKMLPAARTLLSDALRIEPTNYLAWYNLALVHKAAGRLVDAMDCFQAASMLEESEPVESFGSIR
ncbi:protein NPG1-like [Andrographis paniculata]|uniref:protein NPG1-like n=1 Tax=Andrographis paniculata TaxID=175694 RepID=UPI0021E76A14|nr:protein NPG1-like [Andrographis paniculata]XP_051114895.1 protein NPG1-like [Andrographis paniculata]